MYILLAIVLSAAVVHAFSILGVWLFGGACLFVDAGPAGRNYGNDGMDVSSEAIHDCIAPGNRRN